MAQLPAAPCIPNISTEMGGQLAERQELASFSNKSILKLRAVMVEKPKMAYSPMAPQKHFVPSKNRLAMLSQKSIAHTNLLHGRKMPPFSPNF